MQKTGDHVTESQVDQSDEAILMQHFVGLQRVFLIDLIVPGSPFRK